MSIMLQMRFMDILCWWMFRNCTLTFLLLTCLIPTSDLSVTSLSSQYWIVFGLSFQLCILYSLEVFINSVISWNGRNNKTKCKKKSNWNENSFSTILGHMHCQDLHLFNNIWKINEFYINIQSCLCQVNHNVMCAYISLNQPDFNQLHHVIHSSVYR